MLQEVGPVVLFVIYCWMMPEVHNVIFMRGASFFATKYFSECFLLLDFKVNMRLVVD